MKIVLVAKSMMLSAGSAPLLYLMIALSVVSMAIMLERAWMFGTMREDLDALLRDLGAYLSAGDLVGARARFSSSRSAEAAVVVAGLGHAARGPEAAAEAMAGAMIRVISGNADALTRLLLAHLRGTDVDVLPEGS